jgi:hypothetical protein
VDVLVSGRGAQHGLLRVTRYSSQRCFGSNRHVVPSLVAVPVHRIRCMYRRWVPGAAGGDAESQ